MTPARARARTVRSGVSTSGSVGKEGNLCDKSSYLQPVRAIRKLSALPKAAKDIIVKQRFFLFFTTARAIN